MSQAPQVKHSTIPIYAIGTQSSDPAIEQSKKLLRLFTSADYVNKADLDTLGIQLAGIDMGTGMPSDNGPRLIELAPPIDPATIVGEDGKDVLHQSATDPTDPDYHSGNLHEALFLSYFFSPGLFRCCLRSSNESILQRSPWVQLYDLGDKAFLGKFKSYFYIAFELGLRDQSWPDLMCYLISDAPPKDDELYIAELLCIMRFGLGRLRATRYRSRHQTAAVTVISGAGRMIRIVQGYVDDSEGTVLVRKSKFVDLNKNKEKNLEKLMQISRWVLGQPCREEQSNQG
ncbi:hypothetical protein GGR54DRAFT_585595 [Hypoxylon sp. NC1633]|nr:hypothetical protein GGR54DRAFT_585595 [Hypoxylon sp. NC1633]